ncbi:putative uncharacterized protein [Firmicutes bacterium CAG:83]|nr:putative uncharacterized protein [Firmicutes bacterium CAG:83]
MKKLTALLLSLAMVFSLAACGNTANTPADTSKDDAQTPAVSPVEKPDDTNTPDDAETPDDANTPADTTGEQPQTGKTLVVYFSASGNTARVAKDIAAATGADLFEIVPTQVYTSDDLNWTNANSRVSREHDDESLRNVPLTSPTVADWSGYDTVFIGYPIWWGIAAWPVNSFVTDNDFTGKTVIPFATSSSSGMGQSGTLLANMAGTGDWQEVRPPGTGGGPTASPPALLPLTWRAGSTVWACNRKEHLSWNTQLSITA